MNHTKKQPVTQETALTARVPQELKERLEALAVREDRTVSSLVRLALEALLRKRAA
jgi:predicted DNA-binding protein